MTKQKDGRVNNGGPRKEAGRKKRVILKEPQLRFLDEMDRDPTAPTEAAIRAGYNPKSAAVTAHRMLFTDDYPLVKAEWMRRQAVRREIAERETAITVPRIVKELACIGFFNPKMLIDKDGKQIPFKDLPDEVAAAISSVDVSYSEAPNEEGTFDRIKHVSFRLHPKLEALKQLAQHLGHLKEITNININNGTVVNQNGDNAQVTIDWSTMTGRTQISTDNDPLERRIVDEGKLLTHKEGSDGTNGL